MEFKNYYQQYWQKRKAGQNQPIDPRIPSFLRKYSQYGAILNQIKDNSRILDIGCGDGNVSQLYLSKGKVLGLDISEKALEIAKKRGLATKFWDLNQLPLPFNKESFEAVILTDVLEHVLDPLALLKEALRLLTKNGQLLVTVPNFARWQNRCRMLWGDPIDILHFEKYGDELEHLHWFTTGKLKHLLKEAGFKKIKFVSTGLPAGFLFGLFGYPGLAKMLTIKAEK